jgi:hypothetical protein
MSVERVTRDANMQGILDKCERRLVDTLAGMDMDQLMEEGERALEDTQAAHKLINRVTDAALEFLLEVASGIVVSQSEYSSPNLPHNNNCN